MQNIQPFQNTLLQAGEMTQVGKSTSCSSRGSGFSSQHLHSGSQLSRTPFPKYPRPYHDLQRHYVVLQVNTAIVETISQQLEIQLPHNPAILLLGITETTHPTIETSAPCGYGCFVYYSKELESTFCPSEDEWIMKIWSVRICLCM